MHTVPSASAMPKHAAAAARLTIRNAGPGHTIPTKYASANPAKDRAQDREGLFDFRKSSITKRRGLNVAHDRGRYHAQYSASDNRTHLLNTDQIVAINPTVSRPALKNKLALG